MYLLKGLYGQDIGDIVTNFNAIRNYDMVNNIDILSYWR